jgi:uncharacterized membrane protein YtjA (UPF0391 family)
MLQIAAAFFVLALAAIIVGWSGAFSNADGVQKAGRVAFVVFLVSFAVSFMFGVLQS